MCACKLLYMKLFILLIKDFKLCNESVLLPVQLYMGFHSVIQSGLELDENGNKECYSKPI